MKKKLLIAILTSAILLSGCGGSANGNRSTTPEPAVSEEVSEEVSGEALIAGLWGVSALKINGSSYSLKEVEATGDYSVSNLYFVFKEGGSVYVANGGEGTSGVWEFDGTTITAGKMTLTYDSDNKALTIEGDNGVLFLLSRLSDSQDITDIPANKEAPVKEEAPKQEETAKKEEAPKQEETVKKEDKSSAGLDPEFKAMMDEYEEFFDEYVEFMKKYTKSSNPMALMAEYLDFMTEYADAMEELDEIESDELSDADLAYYIDVNARIQKKLLEVY